jgi:hypothetical protein
MRSRSSAEIIAGETLFLPEALAVSNFQHLDFARSDEITL